MKIILMSMPDVAPVIMHESAFHMPNCGMASVGANIDEGHEVFIIDLIRKRRQLRKYITGTLLHQTDPADKAGTAGGENCHRRISRHPDA
jgi:hypothetical protein